MSDKTNEINEAQTLVFRMMALSSFNNFDGESVVASLRENRPLWTSALFTRRDSLLALRDLELDFFNLSTLFLIPSAETPEARSALIALAETWGAGEIDYLDEKEARRLLGDRRSVLRVWWD